MGNKVSKGWHDLTDDLGDILKDPYKDVPQNSDLYNDLLIVNPKKESRIHSWLKKHFPKLAWLFDSLAWLFSNWKLVLGVAGLALLLFFLWPIIEPLLPSILNEIGKVVFAPITILFDLIDAIVLLIVPEEYLTLGRTIFIGLLLEVCYKFNGFGGLWASIFNEEGGGEKTIIARIGHLMSQLITGIFYLLSNLVGLLSSSVSSIVSFIGEYISDGIDLIFGYIKST